MRMIKGLENMFLIQLNENSLQDIVQSSQIPNKLLDYIVLTQLLKIY